MDRELEKLKEYLTSDRNEDAKRDLAYAYFNKLFGKDFKKESDACGSDGYVEGKICLELKTNGEDWLKGFYQGLHYQKLGLSFPYLTVICKDFIGLWRLNMIPQAALDIAADSDSQISPNETGRINSNKTSKALATEILNSYLFRLVKGDLQGIFAKDINIELRTYTNTIKDLEHARVQINLKNFIDYIKRLEYFFDTALEAIHCFYAIVGYWSGSSFVTRQGEQNKVNVIDPNRNQSSEYIEIDERHIADFTRFVETHYIRTNEGSGITYDNYFSRFDEVISRLDPDYAKQHGIFFTDHNLSKFAMWFVHERFEKNLSEKFIVFDPAGGSGNLITSLDWRGHMKHKIVSELQPDLLKVIERRMRAHEKHIGKYTIIPKTLDNKGLNFLDKSGKEYLEELYKVLDEKELKIDKPLAFLLNPPYKNTDENVAAREQVDAEYVIDESILKLTGAMGRGERYLSFLAQIVNMAKQQHEQNTLFNPILMIFTPTSWLIPRKDYLGFRKEFDKHFKYEKGFIITSNEFFALKHKWPLAFTIWTYNRNEKGNNNLIKLSDFTHLKREDLEKINWNGRIQEINKAINITIRGAKNIRFDTSKTDIRKMLPKLINIDTKNTIQQPRYNIYRNEQEEDQGKIIISGFPLKDTRHKRIKAPHGFTDGAFVGFMDDCTPVRLRQENYNRLCNYGDRIWFRLDADFKGINKAKIFAGPADNRSYCAYDLDSAKATLTWYSIAKSCNGRYPIWANQFDIWKPKISSSIENYFYSLCFAFGLAENRCVETKFEEDNPVEGSPEVFVENPMSTNNPDSFWNTVLDNTIVQRPLTAHELVEAVKGLYIHWAKDHCKSGIMRRVGLKDETYFKYFDYDDFLTPNSGLIQIRKYADINCKADLQEHFETISKKTKTVREEIYRILVDEFKYFE
jgi:hypothetical protein